MADDELAPWDTLKDGVLSILKESVKDFVDLEKQETKDLLAELAEQGAKQSWLLTHGSDAEKAQAPGNLRSLKAHAVIGVADDVIVASRELKATFVKVVETVGHLLIQYGPKLLAAL
jgi:hypothetical protein